MVPVFQLIEAPVLKVLGIPCGRIFVDKHSNDPLIYALDSGAKVIAELASQAHISEADGQMLREQMAQVGILATEAEVGERIGQWEWPEFLVHRYEFRPCVDLPLRHVRIYRCSDGGGNLYLTFLTVFQGFISLSSLVVSGVMLPEEAGGILQQMVQAGLAMNADELRQRVDSLPENQRAIAMGDQTVKDALAWVA